METAFCQDDFTKSQSVLCLFLTSQSFHISTASRHYRPLHLVKPRQMRTFPHEFEKSKCFKLLGWYPEKQYILSVKDNKQVLHYIVAVSNYVFVMPKAGRCLTSLKWRNVSCLETQKYLSLGVSCRAINQTLVEWLVAVSFTSDSNVFRVLFSLPKYCYSSREIRYHSQTLYGVSVRMSCED